MSEAKAVTPGIGHNRDPFDPEQIRAALAEDTDIAMTISHNATLLREAHDQPEIVDDGKVHG